MNVLRDGPAGSVEGAGAVESVGSVGAVGAVESAGAVGAVGAVETLGAVGAVESVGTAGPVVVTGGARGRPYLRSYSTSSRRWSSKNVLDFLPFL